MTPIDLSSLASRAKARHVVARQRIYDVFNAYCLSDYGSAEGACLHCIPLEAFEAMATTPRAELTREQTWSYSSAVWLGTSDFKYFLPRLLELIDPIDARSAWESIERKLPPEGWSVCTDIEREAVAGYVAAAHEQERTAAASAAADVAELLPALIVPTRIVEGLPLTRALWGELEEHRGRVFAEHVRQWQATASLSFLLVLARAVNRILDERTRQLNKRSLSVVPSDDLVISWIRSGAAEQAMLSALEGHVDDAAALLLGSALSNVAQLRP